MTTRARLLVPLFALALLAAGCDEIFCIGIDPASTADQPRFLLGKNEQFEGAAKIYSCGVDGRLRVFLGPDSSELWHTYWEIQIDEGERYVELGSVCYGDTPARFHTTVPAETLPADYIYSFRAGFHGLGNQAYFEITADSLGNRSLRIMTEEEFLAIVNPGG
jgi:hypothetical protein